ncbi:MAG: hypothetical protein PVF43_12145 [Candidatus Eiseniibacteriota bacterium]|jgi:hypothetical protein
MSDFYARDPDSWTWELQSTLLFMMTAFLKSRTATGLLSNADYYDEDVNVYLAGLLADYVDPRFMELSGRYISPFDIDVAEMARAADQRDRYRIYKVNADHLLLQAGIFETASPTPADAPVPEARTASGRGRTYYQLAASYGRSLARRQTAATDVLDKLARGFPGYVTVLHHLRSEYFNLIERLGARDLAEIHTSIDEQEQKAALTERIDHLLDLYSEWLERRDPALLGPLRLQLAAVHELDPDFEFDLPED